MRPGHLTITDYRGLVDGLQVEASGELAIENAGSGVRLSGGAPTPTTPISELDLTAIEKLLPFLAINSEGTPPVLRLNLNRSAGGPLEASGALTGKAFTWRGVEFDSVDVAFETITDSGGVARPVRLRFSSIQIAQGGGQLTGKAMYRPDTRTVTIDHLEAGIDPFTLVAWIQAKPVTGPKGIHFAKPPQLTVSGTIPLGAPDKAKLSGTIAAPSITVATPKGSGLAISEFKSRFTHAEGVLKLPDLEAAIAGGTIAAPSEVRPFAKPPHFTTDLKLEGTSLVQLVHAIDAHDMRADSGTLFATFKGGGEASLAAIDGGGEVRISDTDLGSVPLLGTLGPLFSQIVTVFMGGTSGSGVSCDYQLNKGVFTSSDIRISKSAFEINSTAQVDFPARQLHATGAVATEGITKLVTAPIGKVLELEASGSFDNYTWRFKNLPGLEDIADIGKLIDGGAGNKLGDAGKGVVGTVERDAENVGEDAGKGVKKTLGELEKLIPGKN